MSENVDRCSSESKMTSSSVLFCPQPRDIQFPVGREFWLFILKNQSLQFNRCSLIVSPHLSSLLLSAGRFWSWAAASGWPVSPSVAPAVRTDSCSVTVTPASCTNWEATCSWTVWPSRWSAWRRWTGRQPQRNGSNGSDRMSSSLQVRVQTHHQFIQF